MEFFVTKHNENHASFILHLLKTKLKLRTQNNFFVPLWRFKIKHTKRQKKKNAIFGTAKFVLY